MMKRTRYSKLSSRNNSGGGGAATKNRLGMKQRRYHAKDKDNDKTSSFYGCCRVLTICTTIFILYFMLLVRPRLQHDKNRLRLRAKPTPSIQQQQQQNIPPSPTPPIVPPPPTTTLSKSDNNNNNNIVSTAPSAENSQPGTTAGTGVLNADTIQKLRDHGADVEKYELLMASLTPDQLKSIYALEAEAVTTELTLELLNVPDLSGAQVKGLVELISFLHKPSHDDANANAADTNNDTP